MATLDDTDYIIIGVYSAVLLMVFAAALYICLRKKKKSSDSYSDPRRILHAEGVEM